MFLAPTYILPVLPQVKRTSITVEQISPNPPVTKNVLPCYILKLFLSTAFFKS